MEWEEKGTETISELIMACYFKHCYFVLIFRECSELFKYFIRGAMLTTESSSCSIQEERILLHFPFFLFLLQFSSFLPSSPIRNGTLALSYEKYKLSSTNLIASILVITWAPIYDLVLTKYFWLCAKYCNYCRLSPAWTAQWTSPLCILSEKLKHLDLTAIISHYIEIISDHLLLRQIEVSPDDSS